MGDKNKGKIGLTNLTEEKASFYNAKGYFVDESHPNSPSSEGSPNAPRGTRPDWDKNPILGDTGKGQVKRWDFVASTAIQNLYDQIEEQYKRDKTWFDSIRCREALWNMYRRIAWWVEQNTDPSNNQDYYKGLEYIRERIYEILNTSETENLLHSHQFNTGLDPMAQQGGEWVSDGLGYIKPNDYLEHPTRTFTLEWNIPFEHEGWFILAYGISGPGELEVQVNRKPVWADGGNILENDEYNIRESIIRLPQGAQTFTLKYVGSGNSKLRLSYVEFIELIPPSIEDGSTGAETEVPVVCGKPYKKNRRMDYFNHFDGTDIIKPTFMSSSEKANTDFLDIIKYVSSVESTEWELRRTLDVGVPIDEDEPVIEENIFVLPLQNLAESLPSKMVLEWRVKKKGIVSFEYFVESGGGTSLAFYVNNKLVMSPVRDTGPGWHSFETELSVGQTYKFDWVVTKHVAMESGRNLVAVKNIVVADVIGYADPPMPPDYTMEGEAAEEKAKGKWLIYSENSALATYYRGFPDGPDDMVREFEFDLTSECDGMFRFKFRTNKAKTDRESVDDIIYLDPIAPYSPPQVWVGEEAIAGGPTITTTPNYGQGWNLVQTNKGTGQRWEAKRDGAIIAFDAVVDKAFGLDTTLGFHVMGGGECPPRRKVSGGSHREELGTWEAGKGWMVSTDPRIRSVGWQHFDGYEPRTFATYTAPDIEKLMSTTFMFKGFLSSHDYVEVYKNGEKFRTYHEQNYGYGEKFTYPTSRGDQFSFKIVRIPRPPIQHTKDISFKGGYTFSVPTDPMHQDTMYKNAYRQNKLLNRQYDDNRGREHMIDIPYGSLHNPGVWYTGEPFRITSTIKPGDVLDIHLLADMVDYVNYEAIEREYEELAAQNTGEDLERRYYEDFNPYHTPGITNLGGAMIIEVYDLLGLDNKGDKVAATTDRMGNRTVSIDLRAIGYKQGNCVLNFQYGGKFDGIGRIDVYADDKFLMTCDKDELTAAGFNITDVVIPNKSEFIYFRMYV